MRGDLRHTRVIAPRLGDILPFGGANIFRSWLFHLRLRQKNKSNKGFPFVTLIDSIFTSEKNEKNACNMEATMLY